MMRDTLQNSLQSGRNRLAAVWLEAVDSEVVRAIGLEPTLLIRELEPKVSNSRASTSIILLFAARCGASKQARTWRFLPDTLQLLYSDAADVCVAFSHPLSLA
jgi:hypothetical protein